MRPLVRFLLIATACLALPTGAQAATPFTAGSGAAPDVAVGSDGSGHIVWETDAANTQVGYCRVGEEATACNRTEILSFPGSTEAQSAGAARVFAPAPGKIVIVAGCWLCPTGTQNRTYRWISSNNGDSFGPAEEIGTGPETNGSGAWLDDVGIFVGASAANVKAALVDGEFGVQFATGGLFVYGPQVVRLQGTNKLVAASNDLEVVKYGVFKGGASLNAAAINNVANWEVDKTLSSPEPDNSDTSLDSGPNGVFLTYRNFVAGDTHIGLRHFDPATNTFGGATFIEGSSPIEDNSLGAPDSYQDPSGRIHVVWTSLFEGGRLRYAVSDTSGANFSAAGTLAASEGFYEPEVAAGADGHGFAVWTPGISGAIRVVPLDPLPEPGATPSDTTPPALSGFGIDNPNLRPGQSAHFKFQSTKAGQAVLTIEQRFKGTKKKRKGKKVCVAAKKGQKKNCTAYRKVGEIRQAVTVGANTIEFNGRIAGRKLKPGKYRASLVVTDSAGQVSRTETVNFQVVKPKKPKHRG
ncbi:MAG TPA: hypothetical protein VGF09_04965 [Solirubrobacterales bacterium]|jgi:hypothetical protein